MNCLPEMHRLEVLQLTRNKIGNLPQDFFNGFKSLKVLYLDDCGITEIPESLFSGLDKLEKLWLHKNPITLLGSKIFQDLKSLQNLYLFDLDPNLTIEDHVFDPLVKLDQLVLGWENINQVDGNYNGIQSLKSDAFTQLKSLTNLYMADCNLTFIKKEWFNNLNTLVKLHLWGNQIANLEFESFVGLKHLKILELDSNQVVSYNGNIVTKEEFKQLMRKILNKDVEVVF